MGYMLSKEAAVRLFEVWHREYRIFAPKSYTGGGMYSDLDCIRYGEVCDPSEIVFDRKSNYSFKEVLIPLSQTLFYFTQEQVREEEIPEKDLIVFLRSCDLHAVRRMDDIYLHNGCEDAYYRRLRDKVHFVLMGCRTAFENCFCVDMGTNISDSYDLSFEPAGEEYALDCRLEAWEGLLHTVGGRPYEVVPAHVTETEVSVHIPEELTLDVMRSSMWKEYDSRCIACGRCNFVCPTCSCFTMQDIYYTDNYNSGERRRVQASCMVDGFTDVAGGGSYRQAYGDRMRFKTLHKVLDHKKRFGYQMCVGCGRCDDVCPEYISFSHCIGKLESAMKEVNLDASE